MIFDVNSLLSYGFRISSEDTAELQRAIEDTELFFVKNAIGKDVYERLHSASVGTDDYKAVNGTQTMAGLKKAIAHLSVCALLRDNVNETRYGSVKKRDDYSTPATADELQDVFNYHYAIGRQYVKEVADFLNIKANFDINFFGQYL